MQSLCALIVVAGTLTLTLALTVPHTRQAAMEGKKTERTSPLEAGKRREGGPNPDQDQRLRREKETPVKANGDAQARILNTNS